MIDRGGNADIIDIGLSGVGLAVAPPSPWKRREKPKKRRKRKRRGPATENPKKPEASGTPEGTGRF